MMMLKKASGKTRTIDIARDFSKFPAGRFREDGEWSGAAFRDLLVEALRSGDRVEVVFDGVVAGVASSFLDEAFGGLVRECHIEKALLDERLHLRTGDPGLEDFVALAKRHIEEAHRATAG